MRITRFDWDGQDPSRLAGDIRALQPSLGGVSDPVRVIISAIREEGDSALVEIEGRFAEADVEVDSIRQPDETVASAQSRLDH
jgi:hypothetical protein